MNGIASLPRYSYDPRTQQYTRLNPPPPTPQQQADAALQLERMNYGGDGPEGTDPGAGPGSSGSIGGLGLGLMGLSESVPGIATAIGGAIGGGLANQSIAQNAATNEALAAMNEQAIESQTTMGAFGPVASPTSDVSVTAIGEPGPVSVSAIGPDTATAGLAAMNEAVAAQNEAQTAAPAAVAADVASAVSEAAEAADAATDAGVGGVDGSAGDSGGGDSGGGDSGGDSGGGDAAGNGSAGDSAGDSGAAAGNGSAGDFRYGGQVRRYAQGGMPSLARKVQNEGRRGDSMLVHMTPAEVGGLQSLARMHGGSLSINPETGLPEANFLKSILPMVAGAALTAASGGALTPLTAGMLVGGGYGLATGSLSKGLMAGLGAFGGAGLGSALSAAGATAPAVTGTTAGLASQGAAGAQAAQAAQAANVGNIAAQQAVDAGINIAAAPSSVVTAPGGFGATVGQMGRGLSNVIQGTEGARGAFMSSVGGPMGLAKNVGAAATPMLAATPEPYETGKGQAYIRPFKYDSGYQGDREDFRYRTGARGESTAEQRYFDQRFTPVGVYKAGTEPAYGSYAGGGITALKEGGNLPPRYLEGSGDGMSDSIKARIGGLQEARLADGEFVIPADVVSHLGNGSSNAGAKKLHAMMDRIRKARTGKKGQAPEVKTERFMPA